MNLPELPLDAYYLGYRTARQRRDEEVVVLRHLARRAAQELQPKATHGVRQQQQRRQRIQILIDEIEQTLHVTRA